MGKIGIYDPKGLGPPVLMNMLKDQRMVIEQAAFKNILCRMGHLASHRKQTKHIWQVIYEGDMADFLYQIKTKAQINRSLDKSNVNSNIDNSEKALYLTFTSFNATVLET